MTRNQKDLKLVERICRGNQEAMTFLALWANYCHGIDDIIDGDRRTAEETLEIFALAPVLFSHPFYLQHLEALKQIVLNVTSMYADTVAWEKSSETWQRQWADHHRHCSNEMVVAVATLCGGYPHARSIMPELRTMAWHEHHDQKGKPK